MPRERIVTSWSAGGLLSGLLAAAALGQSPVPPTGPDPRACKPVAGGPIKRSFHHVGRVLQDNLVGYPQEFVEPPPGFYVSEIFGTMRGKANIHRFTLYQSDFLAGTDRLSPTGAARFNLMATRLGGWIGPVVVEWSPDQPGLAEVRRASVVAMIQGAGLPMIPERVVIGPSPYPGLLGTDAANNYNVLISRDQGAPAAYTLTPVAGAGLTGSN